MLAYIFCICMFAILLFFINHQFMTKKNSSWFDLSRNLNFLFVFLSSLDWPLLATNMPKQSLEKVPHYAPSPSALPSSSFKASGQLSDVHRTFPPLPDTGPLKASENYYSETSDTVLDSTFMPPQSYLFSPEHPSAPQLSSSKLTDGDGISSKISSRLSREVKPPVPQEVPTSPETVTQDGQLTLSSPSSSTKAINISPSPLLSTKLDSPEEPPFPPPELQTRVTINSVTPPKHAEPSTRIRGFDNLHVSHDLNVQNDAYAGDHQLNPSHALFGNHYVMTSSTEPTMGPPEDFFPTNTMDVDYGSGDYLETMSFMGSEGDDYSLITNLPSNMYDFEDTNSESYDTSFPTRIVMPLSTRHLSPIPTSVISSMHVTSSLHLTSNQNSSTNYNSANIPNVKNTVLNKQMTSINIKTSSSPTVTSINNILEPIPIYTTIYSGIPNIQPTAVHSLPPLPTVSASLNQSSLVNENSESNSGWLDNITIEPTDVLLPDMNSLEYYTIQLTKSNESLPEQRGNQTTSKSFSVIPVSTTHVMATSTYTVDPSHMLTVMYGEELQAVDNNSWPEDSSTDMSGFDPFNTTTLDLSEVRPSLTNTTVPFLDSSLTLTPPMDFSTSLWNLTLTPDWISTEPVPSAIDTSTSLLLSSTPSEELDVLTSSTIDVHWFVNSTLPETLLPTHTVMSDVLNHTSSVTALDESVFNSTSNLPVTEMADQGITGLPSEIPFTEVTDDALTTSGNTETLSTPVFDNETTEATSSTITFANPADEAFNTTSSPTTAREPSATTQKTITETTTVREYLCNITKPDTYLVRVGKT